ncbi:TIGR01666 family membrane protein [Dictyobacter sp. S3.2.2.5]|uniref:TIGR01666 family membrane protein n=2 Tax=Dictyobacter halimunensis TaxID=3026934 RepID=A0ABQ6FKG6_9CHLR|nr:TIGR01666 family membrane protein [Dictyobacter sp. S3.2.2.5]
MLLSFLKPHHKHAPNATHAYIRTMITLDTAAWRSGVRMTIIVVVPLLIGVLTAHLALSVMALLSALGVAFADVGGAYQNRAISMFSAAICMAVTALIATITGANPWLVTLLMFALAFFGSMLGIYGHLAGKVGFSTTLVFILVMGQPASIGVAWMRVLLFIIGAAWSLAVSLWFWPFRPFHPARQAVSGYYQAVSALLRKASHIELEQHWNEEVKKERARLQGAHDKAHHIVAGQRSQRLGAHPFNYLLLMLVLRADSIMEAVIALAEELAVARTHNYHQGEQPAFAQTMEQCAKILEQLAHTIAGNKQALRPETLERSLYTIETQEYVLRNSLPQLEKDYYALANTRKLGDPLEPKHSLVHAWLSLRLVNTRKLANLLKRMGELIGETRDLLMQSDDQEILKEMLQAGATSKGNFSCNALYAVVRERVSLFKDNLTLRSFTLRHALRLATISAAAVAIAKLLRIPDGSWIALNILFILRPDYGSTREQTVQRILGTVIGAILGMLLITALHISFLFFPVLIVLSFLCFSYQEGNNTVFILFFTTFIIIMLDLTMPEHGLVPLIRIATTLAGGGMCILASYLFWPLWERERLPQQMGRTILANRAYIASVLAAYMAGGNKQTELEAVRRASKGAHLQNVNAAAAFQRMLSEQKATENEIERLHILVTYNQRICDNVTALAAHISTRPGHDEFHQLERFSQQMKWMLLDVEDATRTGQRIAVNPPFKGMLRDVLASLSAALHQ